MRSLHHSIVGPMMWIQTVIVVAALLHLTYSRSTSTTSSTLAKLEACMLEGLFVDNGDGTDHSWGQGWPNGVVGDDNLHDRLDKWVKGGDEDQGNGDWSLGADLEKALKENVADLMQGWKNSNNLAEKESETSPFKDGFNWINNNWINNVRANDGDSTNNGMENNENEKRGTKGDTDSLSGVDNEWLKDKDGKGNNKVNDDDNDSASDDDDNDDNTGIKVKTETGTLGDWVNQFVDGWKHGWDGEDDPEGINGLFNEWTKGKTVEVNSPSGTVRVKVNDNELPEDKDSPERENGDMSWLRLRNVLNVTTTCVKRVKEDCEYLDTQKLMTITPRLQNLANLSENDLDKILEVICVTDKAENTESQGQNPLMRLIGCVMKKHQGNDSDFPFRKPIKAAEAPLEDERKLPLFGKIIEDFMDNPETNRYISECIGCNAKNNKIQTMIAELKSKSLSDVEEFGGTMIKELCDENMKQNKRWRDLLQCVEEDFPDQVEDKNVPGMNGGLTSQMKPSLGDQNRKQTGGGQDGGVPDRQKGLLHAKGNQDDGQRPGPDGDMYDTGNQGDGHRPGSGGDMHAKGTQGGGKRLEQSGGVHATGNQGERSVLDGDIHAKGNQGDGQRSGQGSDMHATSNQGGLQNTAPDGDMHARGNQGEGQRPGHSDGVHATGNQGGGKRPGSGRDTHAIGTQSGWQRLGRDDDMHVTGNQGGLQGPVSDGKIHANGNQGNGQRSGQGGVMHATGKQDGGHAADGDMHAKGNKGDGQRPGPSGGIHATGNQGGRESGGMHGTGTQGGGQKPEQNGGMHATGNQGGDKRPVPGGDMHAAGNQDGRKMPVSDDDMHANDQRARQGPELEGWQKRHPGSGIQDGEDVPRSDFAGPSDAQPVKIPGSTFGKDYVHSIWRPDQPGRKYTPEERNAKKVKLLPSIERCLKKETIRPRGCKEQNDNNVSKLIDKMLAEKEGTESAPGDEETEKLISTACETQTLGLGGEEANGAANLRMTLTILLVTVIAVVFNF